MFAAALSVSLALVRSLIGPMPATPNKKTAGGGRRSFRFGVDALDFALALDSGHCGSLMSFFVLAGARTYRSNPTLKLGEAQRRTSEPC